MTVDTTGGDSGGRMPLTPRPDPPDLPARSGSIDGRVTASSSQTSAAAEAGDGGSGGGVASSTAPSSRSGTGTVAESSMTGNAASPGKIPWRGGVRGGSSLGIIIAVTSVRVGSAASGRGSGVSSSRISPCACRCSLDSS